MLGFTQVFSISGQGHALCAGDVQLPIGRTGDARVTQVLANQQPRQHEQRAQSAKRACQQRIKSAIGQLRVGHSGHA